jgi:hypothetical protein
MTISATNISLTAIRNEFLWIGSNRYNGAANVAYINQPYKMSDFAAGGEVVPKNDGSLSGITRYPANTNLNFSFGEFSNKTKPVLFEISYDAQGGYDIYLVETLVGYQNTSRSGIKFYREGYAEVFNGSGGGRTVQHSADWITDGHQDYDNEEYEIKLEQTADYATDGIQGTNNSWVKLNSSPEWYVEALGIYQGESSSVSSGNIQIRRAPANGATPYIVDQMGYYLDSNVVDP